MFRFTRERKPMDSTLPRTVAIALFATVLTTFSDAQDLTDREKRLASGHPRPSYFDVEDIAAMEAALDKQLASRDRHSFSRGWWAWDRLRARYVDGGRKEKHALRILRSVFRGLLLDAHQKLEAAGEGDLFYIYFVTTAPGTKTARKLGDRTLVRDKHGGGYHGGWGGAARMRIYNELVREGMLTAAEQEHFRKIVEQSLSKRFLDFRRGSQSADNHSYGNAGGVALGLKLFPDHPNAAEGRAWVDRIWGKLSDFGDWKEWTYYPYGPIFLHGLIDIAEATGRIDDPEERALIRSVAGRVLEMVHGAGVRGNPNSGCRVRRDRTPIYEDPWNHGYYEVETSARDGNFWYRLAQHFRDPEYLWAAEQVLLGGRPANGRVPPEYEAAYKKRFGWFSERGIEPRQPTRRATIGHLSPAKSKIPERIYLNHGSDPGKPMASFFLYEHKSAHLDNVSGHLFEYSARGAKFLGTAGKYNNVYNRDKTLKGGGTGEESLDLLLVNHQRHAFPLHPDRLGDERDFLRRGSLEHEPESTRAENNDAGDAYGHFSYRDYYGPGSHWLRQSTLTKEGVLVVADTYVGGESLGEDYLAGPVWHLAKNVEFPEGRQDRNWFDAPALDHAWWQKDPQRVVLWFHADGKLTFGSVQQRHSQDIHPNRTVFASRPIRAGKKERFLSIFVPHATSTPAQKIATSIESSVDAQDVFEAKVGTVRVNISPDGNWIVNR